MDVSETMIRRGEGAFCTLLSFLEKIEPRCSLMNRRDFAYLILVDIHQNRCVPTHVGF